MGNRIRIKAPRKKFMPSKDVRGHLVLGQTFVSFEVDGSLKMTGDNKVTADEMAALAHINELLRRLRSGKIVTYEFDPFAFGDENAMVSCEWLASGRLKLNMEDDGSTPRSPSKRYDHAWSIADAMAKHRTFTCSMQLYMMLPRKRAPREEDILEARETGKIEDELTEILDATAGGE